VDERLDRLADEGRAPQSAADQNLETGLAGRILVEPKANIVDLDRGAVVRGRGDRELELARQERKFGMQRSVLPQDFRPDAGILDLAGRHSGPLIRGDVTRVVAGGLHRMNADIGEVGERIRQLGELDPVELDILTRGEMAVATVVFARDVGEPAELVR